MPTIFLKEETHQKLKNLISLKKNKRPEIKWSANYIISLALDNYTKGDK